MEARRQAASDDLLVLERDNWEDFRFRYNVLQNRPLLFASRNEILDFARSREMEFRVDI